MSLITLTVTAKNGKNLSASSTQLFDPTRISSPIESNLNSAATPAITGNAQFMYNEEGTEVLYVVNETVAAVQALASADVVTPRVAQEAITLDGAVSIATYYTTFNDTAGAIAATLADGSAVGQLKKVQFIVDAGNGVVLTPANLSGGTTITFADAGDFALLVWDGSNWVAIELGNTIDGATAPVVA